MEIHCSLNISTYRPIYAFLRGLRPQLHQRQFVLLLGCLLKGLNNCVNATPLWPHCSRSISSQPSLTERNTGEMVHFNNTKDNPHIKFKPEWNIRQNVYNAHNFSIVAATIMSMILHKYFYVTHPYYNIRVCVVCLALKGNCLTSSLQFGLKQWRIKIKRKSERFYLHNRNWNVSSQHRLHL